MSSTSWPNRSESIVTAGPSESSGDQGFALFDTSVGRCGIAWGSRGLLGVGGEAVGALPVSRQLVPVARRRRTLMNAAAGIDDTASTIREPAICRFAGACAERSMEVLTLRQREGAHSHRTSK